MAAIYIAARLLHEALRQAHHEPPWELCDPWEDLYEEIGADAEDADRGAQALRDVVSWAGANESSFYPRGGGDPPPGGWLGKWELHNWASIAFSPKPLRKMLSEEGYVAEEILASWKERGWLETPGGKARGYQVQKRLDRVSMRLSSGGMSLLLLHVTTGVVTPKRYSKQGKYIGVTT